MDLLLFLNKTYVCMEIIIAFLIQCFYAEQINVALTFVLER
jgi:hypothetical protein